MFSEESGSPNQRLLAHKGRWNRAGPPRVRLDQADSPSSLPYLIGSESSKGLPPATAGPISRDGSACRVFARPACTQVGVGARTTKDTATQTRTPAYPVGTYVPAPAGARSLLMELINVMQYCIKIIQQGLVLKYH